VAIRVDREQVLAYRVARQGLHRTNTPVDDLDVVDLGVQDTPVGSARQSFGARTNADTDDHSLVRVWALRASPYLHHASDLPKLATALWRDSGELRQAAEAFREVITGPTVKGAASTAVTRAVPKALVTYCRGCQAEHIFESLFRQAALPAGIRLDLDSSPPVLVPIDDWPGIPAEQAGTDDLIRRYLTFVGPASHGDVAGWLDTTQREVRAVWPGGLVEVDVDGRTTWLPESEVDLLRNPPEPPRVRLLPTSDPFLQERNRPMLVPDRTRHKEMWPVIGQPGAVLVDGAVAGIWRPKATRKKLELRITQFVPIPRDVHDELAAEATRLGALRGIPETTVQLN
jgi:hypothetical protein